MVVALTRDGQFKVEAITDEFVTLDTTTRTDVMAKLDAVVKGDMDDTYKVREENVNVNSKKKGKKDDDDGVNNGNGEGGSGKKQGTKKRTASAAKGGAGNAAKKRKTAA